MGELAHPIFFLLDTELSLWVACVTLIGSWGWWRIVTGLGWAGRFGLKLSIRRMNRRFFVLYTGGLVMRVKESMVSGERS